MNVYGSATSSNELAGVAKRTLRAANTEHPCLRNLAGLPCGYPTPPDPTPTPTTPTQRAPSPARGVVGFYTDADGYLDVTSDWEPDVGDASGSELKAAGASAGPNPCNTNLRVKE